MRKLLVLVSLLGLLLAACRAETNLVLTVEEDGSGTLGFELGMDEELRDLVTSSGGSVDDILGDMEVDLPGAESYERTEGDMTFVGARAEFASIDDLEALLAQASNGPGFDEFSLTLDERTAEFRAKLDPTADLPAGEELPFDPSELAGEIFSFNLVVKLPGEVVEHNADEIRSDGALVWKVSFTQPTEAYARTDLGGGTAWWIWLAVAAVIVVGSAGAFFAARASRRSSVVAVTAAAGGAGEPLPPPPSDAAEPSTPDGDGDEGDEAPSDPAS